MISLFLAVALLWPAGAIDDGLDAVEVIAPGLSDKYPTLAFDGRGRLWLARVVMTATDDTIVVRSRMAGRWSTDTVLARGVVGAPRLLGPGRGDRGLWLFWHERRDGAWRIVARRFDGRRWQVPIRVMEGDGSALHPSVARDADGRVWVVYETIEGSTFGVAVRTLNRGVPSPAAPVASGEGRAIDRRPAIASAPDGGVWIAWDRTRGGNADIYLARARAGARGHAPDPGEPVAVTADASIDDTPSLAVDPEDGTVWIAWNSMRGDTHERLRTSRHSGGAWLRAYRHGRWLVPASPHPGGLPGQVSFGAVDKTPRDAVAPYWHWRQTQNYPVVHLDAARRPWVVWRTDATGAHNFDLWARVYDRIGWSPELHLTTPYGGRDECPTFARAPGGELWLAWEGQPDPAGAGRRPLGQGDVDAFNTLAAPNGVFLGRLALPPEAAISLAPLREAEPDVYRREELGPDPAPGPPAGGVPTEKGRFTIYFGDPHSHSTLSDAKVGLPDQVLALARDRVGLDFAVVSDHSEMGRLQHNEYAEIKSIARAFTEPGRFLSFSGFEWTAGARYGHRVVLFKQDDPPQLAFSAPEGDRIEALYTLARAHDGILSPHHTAQATWGRWSPEHFDETVEPNFEIASWHGRFEFYGNPWEGRRQVPGHQYQDQLRRGRKVGVMGASDTHHLQPGQGGLTAVLAEDLTREAVFEAVRRRRIYATTGDKIVLEFTANGNPMGSEIVSDGPLSLRVRVEGTAPIDRVEIVKNLVDTFAAVRIEQSPSGPDGVFLVYDPADPDGGRRLPLADMHRLTLAFEDCADAGQPHVYYVRVTQANGQQAWSSPVWVTFR